MRCQELMFEVRLALRSGAAEHALDCDPELPYLDSPQAYLRTPQGSRCLTTLLDLKEAAAQQALLVHALSCSPSLP